GGGRGRPPATAPQPPAAPAVPPEPESAPERDATQAPPEVPRQPEPPVPIVPAREAAPDVAARSEASAPSAELPTSRGGASGERTVAVPEQSGGRGGASA